MATSKQVLFTVVPAAAAVGVIMAIALGGVKAKQQVTIPAGTTFVAALEGGVSTESVQPGTAVTLRTQEAIRLPEALLPSGLTVRGEVTHAKGGGRLAGAPELTLRFRELVLDGRSYPIEAEPFRVVGKDDAGETLAEIGVGAAGGGLVGGLIGGGRGAAKGVAVGAVLGTGVAVATDGDEIVLPAGQQLRVQTSAPVEVEFRPPSGDDRT